MKKLTIFFTFACLLTLSGCSSNDEILNRHNDDGAGVYTRAPGFSYLYQAVFSSAAGYLPEYVGTSPKREEFHRTVYAAAYSHWLYNGQYGDGNIYTPVLCAWLQRAVNAGPMTAGIPDVEGILALQANGTRAGTMGEPGELYTRVLSQLKGGVTGNNIDGIPMELKPTYTAIATMNAIPGVVLIPTPDISGVISVIEEGIAHRETNNPYSSLKPSPDYFSFFDGTGYLLDIYRDQDVYKEVLVDIIGYCLPYIVKSTPAQRAAFLSDLKNKFATDTTLREVLGTVYNDQFLEAIAVAIAAANGWGEEDPVVDTGWISLESKTVTIGDDEAILYDVNSNTYWRTEVVVPVGETQAVTVSPQTTGFYGDASFAISSLGPNNLDREITNYVKVHYQKTPNLWDEVTITVVRLRSSQPIIDPIFCVSSNTVDGDWRGGNVSLDVEYNTTWRIDQVNGDFFWVSRGDGETVDSSTGTDTNTGTVKRTTLDFYFEAYINPHPPGTQIPLKTGSVRLAWDDNGTERYYYIEVSQVPDR